MYLKGFLLFTGLSIFALNSNSQTEDTLHLSLNKAEDWFFQRNYQLLASKFHINAAEAGIITAKLWENPSVVIEQSAFDYKTHKWFETGQAGETSLAAEQLISLGGKRRHRIEIEKINTRIATSQFYDLIRTLRFELRTSFWQLYHLQQTLLVYDQEIKSINTLIQAYQIQLRQGNISFRELARIQALKFTLENEQLQDKNEYRDNELKILLLTADTTHHRVLPVMDHQDFTPPIDSLKLATLLDTAYVERYDYQIANQQVILNKETAKLQRSMRIPDFSLSARWDKQGGYINNYNAVSLQASIPLWNRNQGNIKQAENLSEESAQLALQLENSIKTEIYGAFAKLYDSENLYIAAKSHFNESYDKMLEGITLGYQNRTISLLEFIDYFETYKDSKIAFYQLHQNVIEAVESINLATGKIWFNN